MYSSRPTLYGSRHAISTGHYLASSAGFAILEAGGNAIDAGCAAGMTLGVVLPDLVNIAGVAPIMIRTATGLIETISGVGCWPASIPSDLFNKRGEIPEGVLRTVVPAAPDAWITALARRGTMRFSEVASAAIKAAAEGFAVGAMLADTIREHRRDYERWVSNSAIFLPNGKVPSPGDRFLQSDLARTLTYMADQDRAAPDRLSGLRAAHSAFYRGDIAQKIVAFHRAEGGFLSVRDLASFRSVVEPAVVRLWRGHEVAVCGPWCQGATLLEALLIFEAAGFEGLGHNSPAYLHRMVGCINLAMSDRERFFGDPAHVHVPIDHLLSPKTIAQRTALLRDGVAFEGMPPAADGRELLFLSSSSNPTAESDTSYVAVVDKWGNAFSATPSDASWDSPVVPGLGIVPSSRGSQSRPTATHPARVGPGRRPRLTPSPAMIILADGGVMPLGSPGGDVQIQAMLQVLLNILHFDMELQDAVEVPRIASFSFPSSFSPFDYFPSQVAVEGRVAQTTQAQMSGWGHRIVEWPEFTWLAGGVSVVRSYPSKGLLAAGADPRRTAYAVVS